MTLFKKASLAAACLFVSFNAYAFKVKADQLLLFSSASSTQTLHYLVNKNNLAQLPDWDGSGNAPLNIDDAKELAINKHKKQFEKAKLRSISLKSKKTHCKSGQSCPDTLWYYKAKVKGGEKRTYIILLDGSFVSPRKG